MKRICVFCGSSPGNKQEYSIAAELLGKELVRQNIELVYGGASVGLMGKLAKTVLNIGGKVIGVMPESLVKLEVALNELKDLRIVNSMHERKTLMAELSDAFIALPGGLGTIEEMFEMMTWVQLGIHNKPIGLLNINRYYDKLTGFLNHAIQENFIKSDHLSMLWIDDNPKSLIFKLKTSKPQKIDKAGWALDLLNS